MLRLKGTIFCAGALLLAVPGLAIAEQITLPFRLVTQQVSQTTLDAAADPGRTIRVSQNVGTAVFEDGRIAHKTFVLRGDNGQDSGDFTGYSTYVFQNGDSLNLKFVGGWSSERVGGDYEVLSGTGAFEGATGTGKFDFVDTGWEGAELYDGQFTLDMPGS
jgi:hypothetical protein